MVNNDSDSDGGDLMQVPSIPMPDDDVYGQSAPRDSGKVAMPNFWDEPKTLGAFPKERNGSSSENTDGRVASDLVPSGGISVPQGGSPVQTQTRKKTIAKDLGLY